MRIPFQRVLRVGYPHRVQELQLSRQDIRPVEPNVKTQHLVEVAANTHRRVERGCGVLRDVGYLTAPHDAQGRLGQAQEVGATEQRASAENDSSRMSIPDRSQGSRALAAPRLPRESMHHAGIELQIDPRGGLQDASLLLAIADAEALNYECGITIAKPGGSRATADERKSVQAMVPSYHSQSAQVVACQSL